MFTINYKGFFIHGYIDRPEVRVQSKFYCRSFKSIHAAKCGISKFINQ